MKQKTSQELMAMREEHVPQGPFNVTPLFVEIVDLSFVKGTNLNNLKM